jgi:DNA-binding XRE family transcriptional regulator
MTGRNQLEVARLFRVRRKEIGLTQVDAAKQARISTPTWIRMEAGERSTPATRRAAAIALGWAADAHTRLLTGEDPDSLVATTPEPLSCQDGLAQLESILHRMDLTPDRVDIAMTLIQRLMEQP